MESRTSTQNVTGQGTATSNRRPMNAFLLFCKRHRAIVKEKHPHLENRLISKILGEWWTSLDLAEKSKFNNLASEYKEHLMREQPNFSYNKKQPNTVQVSVNQSASTSNSSSGSVKAKGENFGPVLKVPSYETSSKQKNSLHEHQDGQGHIVQLQQRTGNEQAPQKTLITSVMGGPTSSSNSRGVSRESSSASSPEPRSPDDAGNSVSNSNSNASMSLGCTTNNSGTVSREADSPPKTLLHFKKRYLAAEKAKIASSKSTSSNSCSPKNHQELVPLENVQECSKVSNKSKSQGTASEEACEALLQLAGSGSNPSIKNVKSVSNSRSRSGTSSPPDCPATNNSSGGEKLDQNQPDVLKAQLVNGNSNGNRYKVERQEKAVVRDAVWPRIAKTLLMQQDASTKEEEEEAAQGDKPINLSTSSLLLLDGQTIIEHVIENILDKPSEFELSSKRTSAENSKEGSKSPSDRNVNSGLAENGGCHLNNNASANGGGMKGNITDISCITEEEVKERIYASLKQDIMRRNADTSCKEEINERDKLRWKTLPHQNINCNEQPKQQQIPNGVISGSHSALQMLPTSKSSVVKTDPPANKVTNIDPKQQTIQTTTIPSNCSVTKLSKSLDNHSAVNHNQLSVSKLPEPTAVQQQHQQLQIFTTSVPSSHVSEKPSSIRNSIQQPPVSVTLVSASGSAVPGQGYGANVHIPVSSDSTYKIQVQEAPHAHDLPLNLSTTPPQTPAGMSSVTITASPAKRCRLLTDEDENTNEPQHLRNDRACKGRRYQEFKDQALGRKGSRNNSHNRSGERSSLDGNDSSANHTPEAINRNISGLGNIGDASVSQNDKQQSNALPSSVQTKQQRNSVSVLSHQPFDVEKELNAIPALSLEEFQQKVLNSRQQQQAHVHHARSNSISPNQNSASVSLTPTSIVATNHVAGAPGVSISQASVAIVNNQSSANISYHPQTLVVTKQSPNGTIVAAPGLPITMIGNKRPLVSASTSIPSVVPVITATAISNYQSGPQEQHQIQIQPVGRGGGKFSKRITTAAGQET